MSALKNYENTICYLVIREGLVLGVSFPTKRDACSNRRPAACYTASAKIV